MKKDWFIDPNDQLTIKGMPALLIGSVLVLFSLAIFISALFAPLEKIFN